MAHIFAITEDYPTMARTNADRHIDRNSLLTERIHSVFSNARHFHLTHRHILTKLSEYVWSSDAYARLPQYYHGYLHAIADAEWRDIQHNMLDWQLFDRVTGEYVDSHTWDKWRMPDGTLRIDSDKSRHVWRGTQIPYDPRED